MKKTILLSTSILMLAGCATEIMQPVKVDKEPILVGIPLGERLSRTENTINNQFDLLHKVQTKSKLGPHEIVVHNNNLDARKGSSKTLPQSYGTQSETRLDNALPNTPEMQQVIKKIEWQNNSANKLAEQFANALGYKFLSSGSKDINISLTIENETIGSAIQKFRESIKAEALLVVSEKGRVVHMVYKNPTPNTNK